ncbi:MAG: sugar phosphate isomerase/epimerase [Oscillospiraceae bacterium]|nr:sugar phosphate isomerase/epimerase [Oscillospiraceae bacterium]
MQFAVSTYSFHRLLQQGEMTQMDCIDEAAALGFDAVEFVDVLAPAGENRGDYAEKLGRHCRAKGLAVSNYTFAADFITGCQGDTAAEIRRVCKELDIAARMGAQSIRHDATQGYPAGQRGMRGFDQALPVLADACREVTDYAESLGIKTMVENHGYFCQESRRVEKLVTTVDHPNFSLLCDMGNFMCADENPALAVARIAPYAGYVHAKDFLYKDGSGPDPGEDFFRTRAGNYLRGTIIGHGVVPVAQCLGILRRNGYDGYVCVEFEGLEEVRPALSASLQNLRRYSY